MENKKQNIAWFDSLRAIATIGVIVIHEATPVVKMSYGGNSGHWWIGNVVDSAVRFAVPMFLLLSGATMLGKEYDLKIFYRKRYTRVLIPFLFWMVVYWIYRWMVLPPSQQPHSFSSVLLWAVNLFGHEGISKHFWYVYMILIFYLLFPLMGYAVRSLKRFEVLLLIVGWAFSCFLLRKMPVNFYSWTDQYPERLLGYFQFSGYLVLGYYLNDFRMTNKHQRWIPATVFGITIVFSALSTGYFSSKTHVLDLSMYGNVTFNTMAQAIAMFFLFKDLVIKTKYVLQLQQLISGCSYGIYLSHILVIGILYHLGIFWNIGHPALTLPALTLLTLAVSLLIVLLLRRLPYGKYISG